MSEPKTLEEELLRAAERADFAALQCTPQAVGVRWSYLRGIHEAEAARLRQRAAWVRDMEAKAAAQEGPAASVLIRMLTGHDIPAASPSPETAPIERKEP